nr:hypothetical protein [Polymorphobacter sp.]
MRPGLTIGTILMLAGASATAEGAKNWTPPKFTTYAQTLADATMRDHPELLSMTFHGVPPGMDKVYTMFAGSYPDRVGNPDDPDDVDVIVKGITVVDPRWHRTKDVAPKFVVQLPLRDVTGQNVGLIVYAFRVPVESNAGERDYYIKALDLRDALAKRIPSYAALFDRAR